MKHPIERLRPVFAGSRYCGALIYSARGWQAHDHQGKFVGEFADDAQAVKRLRKLVASGPCCATEHST
jgi:hypothetical protein